jgi:diketogulonate reductase-like aldo/keto reductase
MMFADAHGARIPLLGLGTWRVLGPTCVRIVEQALRLGYRHIDTAQGYENEAEVGDGLRNSGVPRGEVFVTTKVWPQNLAPRDLIRSTKESLTKLKVSEVDLLLIHWPSETVPLADTLSAMAQVKQAGMTRHIGVSNFNVALMDQAVKLCPEPIVCNQVEYHPLLDQSKVIAACKRLGIAMVAYSPIARGGLGDNDVLEKIGKVHGKSAAQVALRWLMQQGIVAIPRTSRVERLSENIAIFDFELSAAEMAAIDALGGASGRIVNPAFAPKWD